MTWPIHIASVKFYPVNAVANMIYRQHNMIQRHQVCNVITVLNSLDGKVISNIVEMTLHLTVAAQQDDQEVTKQCASA